MEEVKEDEVSEELAVGDQLAIELDDARHGHALRGPWARREGERE